MFSLSRWNHSHLPYQVIALALLIGLLCIEGCATVTISPKKNEITQRPPDITRSVTFSWFGLKGEHNFDVYRLCENRKAEKIQAVHTLKDLLKGVKTLFFYLPKTAKIWCAQNQSPHQ